MRYDPTRTGGSAPIRFVNSLASQYAAQSPKKKGFGWGDVLDAAKTVGGGLISPIVTAADIAAAPFEKISGRTLVDPAQFNSFNLIQSGGRALENVGGDVLNFGKHIITGNEKYWDAMPAVQANKAAGGGWQGALAAASPYLELGGYLAPMVGPALRETGMLAPKLIPYRPLTAREVSPNTNPYVYGVHVSPTADLAEIQARQAMQKQSMAGDAMAGSSYMWDARSPRTIGSIFENPQLNTAANTDLLLTAEERAALPQPNLYITRAPASQVFQDANVPGSSALRVGGNQEVLAQIPFDENSLKKAMEKFAGPSRSANADMLESRYRGLNPAVKADVATRPYQLAEENLRQIISRGPNPYFEKNFPGLSKLDPNASIGELLRDPDARKLFESYQNIDAAKVELMVAPALRETGVLAPKLTPYRPLTAPEIPLNYVPPKPRPIYDSIRGRLASGLADSNVAKSTESMLPQEGALASELKSPLASLAEKQATSTADRIGTVSRMPVDTLSSSEFGPIDYPTEKGGGFPIENSTTRQAYQLPVYQIGNQKIVFGNSSLGRFSPEFTNPNVKFVDLNPYAITSLDKTSAEGRKFAELFFDAYQGFGKEITDINNLGQVSALTYAASRGDKVALKELERLAALGKKEMLNESRLTKERKLSRLPNFDDFEVQSEYPKLFVYTDNNYSTRFFNIDDMFLVHQTDYKPPIDVNGNVILRPTADFVKIDPITGRPHVDPMTGKQLPQPDRGTVHFTINHLAKPHMFRPLSENNTYLIVSPLRDVLNANPGSLDNLLSVDTFLTPKPGEGLIIPMTSGKFMETDSANAFANASKMLDQVGKTYNNLPDYKTLRVYANEHYAENRGFDDLITKIGFNDIPKNFEGYPNGVDGKLHIYTVLKKLEKMSRLTATHDELYAHNLFNSGEGLSTNAKLRFYDSNENKFSTGKVNTTYKEEYSGL